MLIQLSLQDFALIPRTELEFGPGFTVMTGETGAGKSIILDALAAALGERADAQQVRFGSERADITAVFELAGDAAALQYLAGRELLNADDPQTVMLRRVVSAEGRSRAWINGRPASMGDLRELGRVLVAVQGQHSQHRLFENQFARDWLDSQGQLDAQARQVRETWQQWQTARKRLQQSQLESASRRARLVDLEQYIEEFQPLSANSYSRVEQEFDRLSHHGSLMQDGARIAATLDEEEDSINSRLAPLLRLAQHHAKRDPVFEQVTELLTQGQSALLEAGQLLNSFLQDQTLDEQQLQQYGEWLGEFHRLARKHQTRPEDLALLHDSWQTEAASLAELDNVAGLEQAAQEAYQRYMQLARSLEQARQSLGDKLADQLAQNLGPLALPEARFQFSFTAYDTPQADGLSQIDLLFSANRGIPLQSMQKIASGGELSRIALVMQLMNASQQQSPTLVFDEVDVGIGGGTAEVVGKMLRDLSDRVQIISITHQPQVAAQGHQHLHIRKHQTEQAQSEIQWLDDDARIQELARMSGGVDITPETLAHARSLLAGRSGTS